MINEKLQQKMEYVIKGYLFVLLNLVALIVGYNIMGLVFAVGAALFFIKAIRTR